MSTAKKTKTGVIYHDEKKAYEGYTLIAPMGTFDAWLIDMNGLIVHHWPLAYKPGLLCRLLPNGNLLYVGREEENPRGPKKDIFNEKGEKIGTHWMGGCEHVIEVDWDNNLLWEYTNPFGSHDFYRMSNGNTLLMIYEKVPEKIRTKVKGGIDWIPVTDMWCDSLIEVNPKGEIVWEWGSYKYLDPEIDILCPLALRDEWTHANSCAELPNGDILMSIRQLNTIIIIDKKNGEIKWRWGRGELAHQHDATVLENGNILCFDNGDHRIEFSRYCYSRVVEVNPNSKKIVWEYKGEPPCSFFSGTLGGAQRLPNGNTLITSSNAGHVFEVTPDKDIVWEYVVPFYGSFLHLIDNRMVFRTYRFSPDYPAIKGKPLDPNRYKWINQIYACKNSYFKFEAS